MLDFLLSSLLVYQYWLLFGVLLIASIGFPTPATALLIAGGAFYAQGYFELEYLFIAGYVGCVLGDLSGYILSYRYGQTIFHRVGLGKILESSAFHTFEPFFMRRGVLAVFITRFLITGLGPSVNILAGITKMRPVLFVLTDIVGEALYILLSLAIGYSFVSEWESLLSIVESFSSLLASLTMIEVLSYILWRNHHYTGAKMGGK